jgi:ribosomal-protein-alanine N-acetyltransferase
MTTYNKINKSEINFLPTNEASAREFLIWKYEPPYEVYNYAPENFERDLAYHLDPANNLHSIYRDNKLVGYCSYGRDAQVPGGDYSEEALDIGMMIKPELTGQGQGSNYANAVIQNGISKYQPKKLRVTILGTNLRAIRVWEKIGFQTVQSFSRESDSSSFVILTKDI